jgi:hypothetical protein
MRRWVHFGVFLLAAVYGLTGLPWLVGHGFHLDAHQAGQHEHGVSDCPAEAMAVEALVHGHDHPDGVPPHTHGAAPAGPFRHNPPALRLAVGSQAFRFDSLRKTPAHFEVARAAFLTGSDPPSRPYSLCTLLI